MKIFLTILIIFSWLGSNAEGAQISGNANVQPGATETYYVSWTNFHWYMNVYWSVSNGTIISQDQFSVTIQWDNTGGIYGGISVSDDLFSQWGDYQVSILGDPVPSINTVSQTLDYGITPNYLYIYFDFPPNSANYQWQEWSETSQTWGNLSGQNSDLYQPPSAIFEKRYRCIVTVNGTSTYSLESSIFITPLFPGILSLNAIPAYNSSPSISVSNALGGYCYSLNYSFVWEMSLDGGSWTTIGTTATVPTLPATIGNIRVRRKIICGIQQLYTNTLDINPNYTSVDYENRTYMREIVVLKRGITSWQQADQLIVGDKLQNTTYLDGFGRAIQNVSRESSITSIGNWNDVVKCFEYDLNGSKNYIQYSSGNIIGKFKTNALIDQKIFLQNLFNEPANAPTYSEVVYDNSPLSRVVKVMAPGIGWGGNNIGVSASYDFNSDWESVHIWNLMYSTTAIPTTIPIQTYPAGTLNKLINYDEKGSQTISYTDGDGKLILKKTQKGSGQVGLSLEHFGWVCTYYVYNDLGQLSYIITPKAVEWLDNNSWNLSQPIVDELCYKYLYDDRGRLIVSKKPGAEEVYFVYDKKNRPVLSQSAIQRKVNNSALSYDQWSFTLYDQLGRVVAKGIVENDGNRTTLQGYVNNLSNSSITISAFVGNGTYTSVVVDNPVAGSTNSSNYLPGNSNIIFNSITTYDNYAYTGVKSFNNSYSFFNGNDPAAEPILKTDRTTDFTTGEKIRILDNDNNPLNDKFLTTTTYYSERGLQIQTLSDNHKNEVDYQTVQYDFSGKILSEFLSHSISGGSTYTIRSGNIFDKMGRVKEVYKSFNGSSFKELAEYNYNELGHISSKRIDPIGLNSQLETQKYSYNINGLLTGINKDYALNADNYTQWDTYFSEYLGYENRDNLFSDAQFNGKITGVIWRSQGDNTPRKFDYTYDRIGRFTTAIFKQRPKPSETSWSNASVDFSVFIDYEDNNGNIKSMKQMGILPGTNGGIVMDDLRYSYLDVQGITGLKNNKLAKVDDLGDLGNYNGILGDFKKVVSNQSQEYFYDNEGNFIKDLNKDIQGQAGASGVVYNYLNKPIKIVLNNRSQIEYTYDAAGEKLNKIITQFPSPSNNNQTIITTTDYIGDFIYETISGNSLPQLNHANKLLYILHEEGRLKMITPTALSDPDRVLSAGVSGIEFSSTQHGTFEFFIKDHLGNVRMVLTEEVQKEMYRASMDASAATVEEPLFGTVNPNTGVPDNSNELQATRYSYSNNSWPGHNTDMVKLSAVQSNTKIGPNVILKVMAGDIISTTAKYYYYINDPTGPGPSTLPIVNSFIGSLLSPNKGSAIGKAFNNGISSGLNNGMYNFINVFQPSAGSNTNAPLAFISIVFVDEQFNFIDVDQNNPGVGTYSLRVNSANDASAQFPLLSQRAPKNGWVLVYLSNYSNEPVYFDDFLIKQEHSKISEENHYYPFGLKIAGITSHAYNKLANNYGYQGDYSEDETETGWNEFDLRSYDPQIGRWTSVDPFNEFSSPYIGMGDDPINHNDPSGGILNGPTPSAVVNHLIWAVGGGIVGGIAGALDGGETDDIKKGFIVGFGSGFVLSFVPWNNVGEFFADRLPKLHFEEGWQVLPINIGSLPAQDVQQLLWELYSITGMHFQRNPTGLMQYSERRLFYSTNRMEQRHNPNAPNFNPNKPTQIRTFIDRPNIFNKDGTSSVARNKILGTFPYLQSFILPVYDDGSAFDGFDGTGNRGMPRYMVLSRSDLLRYRTVNLNVMTLGIGMAFLHELGHTILGGMNGDDVGGDPLGENERWLNRVRRQLGPSFGRRLLYQEKTIGSQNYIPFDKAALKAVLNGQPPTTKYILRLW